MQKTIKISLAIIIGLIIFESGVAMEKIVNKPKCKEKTETKIEVKKVKTKKDFNKDENILFLGDSITEIYPLYEIYENIADKFKDNNLKNNFGEYYYLCRNVQRKSLKIVPKFFSYIN